MDSYCLNSGPIGLPHIANITADHTHSCSTPNPYNKSADGDSETCALSKKIYQPASHVLHSPKKSVSTLTAPEPKRTIDETEIASIRNTCAPAK